MTFALLGNSAHCMQIIATATAVTKANTDRSLWSRYPSPFSHFYVINGHQSSEIFRYAASFYFLKLSITLSLNQTVDLAHLPDLARSTEDEQPKTSKMGKTDIKQGPWSWRTGMVLLQHHNSAASRLRVFRKMYHLSTVSIFNCLLPATSECSTLEHNSWQSL